MNNPFMNKLQRQFVNINTFDQSAFSIESNLSHSSSRLYDPSFTVFSVYHDKHYFTSSKLQLDFISVLPGRILAGVGVFVMHRFHESIVAGSEDSAQERAEPVNPMIGRKVGRGDGRTKGPRGVERAAGVVDA